MSWQAVMKADEVEPGKVAVVEVDGDRIAICRTADAIYAVADICSHDGGALDQGTLLGERIECPRHGAQFDIKSGKALTLPAVRPIKSYEARIAGDMIEVDVS
jgi:3-phenylpropionate/trans-cinnamate dioxygenase ferredoxin subunit